MQSSALCRPAGFRLPPGFMKQLPALLAVSVLGIVVSAPGARAQSIPGWELVWADEFAQADGSRPDPAKWGYDTGGWGWGNNEWQYYTDRAENARIEGGQLVIEAREESHLGSNYTSARLLTKGKWAWTYGRIEARIKVPRGQGIWPAFWMLGADFDTVGWPDCGEIDVMEHIGREPKNVYGTIHGPEYSGGNSVGGSRTFDADVGDDFHVFAVEWEENVIRWHVDGIHYFSATPASLEGETWVFDHPHFLLLNVAVGGNWPGYPDASTVFPQQMLVDYVRVYARAATPGVNLLGNPGFETGGLNPWIGYSAGGANDPGGFVESTSDRYYNGGNPGGDHVLTHSGTFVAKTFGDFTGGENFNGFYQDLPAEPGSLWLADGWALTHPQDLLSGGNSSWIEVTYRDAADTVLALYRSPALEASTVPAGTWVYLPVTNEIDPASFLVTATEATPTAPAGTTKVRYQVVFRQPVYDGGAIYFDDLNLVRRPVLPESLNPTAVGNTIQFSFPTEVGVTYQMAYATDLKGAVWIPIETFVGDGATKVVSDPVVAERRFYRLQVP